LPYGYFENQKEVGMKKNKLLAAMMLFLSVLAGPIAFGQAWTLAVTANKTVVNGVVAPEEYGFSQDLGKMKIYINRSADTLNVAVVGVTSGWVAIGLGATRMDGAAMLFGYVDSSGKVFFKAQTGRGHGHADAAQAVQDTVIASAMTEAKGETTLEVALKPAVYLKAGQAKLELIYAQGSGDSFTSMHSFERSVTVSLAAGAP
jgi:hypothetical protein